MTGNGIIQTVKTNLFDLDLGAPKWSNEQYLNALNAALSHLWALVPESRIDRNGVYFTFTPLTVFDLNNELSFSDIYFSAVVEYMLYVYYSSMGKDDLSRSLATYHYNLFYSLIRPGR